MTVAVGWALASLFFTGLIDVAFKRYSRKARSRGVYLLGMGLVWAALQIAFFLWRGETLALGTTTLGYGLAAGVAVTVSNLLLIESLGRLDVSLGSTIYRLNTVGVVVLAFLVLGEPIGTVKLAGIACGVVAVLVLYHTPSGGVAERALSLFFWLAVLAALGRALYGVISKAGLSAGASPAGLMTIAALCWVAGGLLYAVLREGELRPSRVQIVYGLVCGVIVFLIVNTLILGLEHGDATIVIPIANLGFVIALVISVGWRMERLTARKLVAVGLAAAAVVLLSRAA